MTSVGVLDLSSTAWTAGGAYSVVTAQSLVAASAPGDEVLFVGRRPGLVVEGTRPVRVADVRPVPGEARLRRRLGLPARAGGLPGERRVRTLARLPQPHDPEWAAERAGADVVFPVTALPVRPPGPMARVAWIPDFQHLTNPSFFTPAEIATRDVQARQLAEHAHVVVLSSEAAKADFLGFVPEHADKARVVSFPSRYAFDALGSDPGASVQRYRLPERFLLCANQFWSHKNHRMLVEALGLLADRGVRIPVVMTGMLADYRDPSNALLSELLQTVASSGVHDLVHVLGLVPRADLEGLLRASVAVVQPSSSEGWNTTVQDAVALGRPLVCSDIAVHREQAPSATFFSLDSVASLAAALEVVWDSAGTSPEAEPQALQRERELAAAHGQALLAACRDAVERARR